MPAISIIVPIYKVEAYLERCLDSIARQTFSDFEALLVDDGSPDGCGAICDRWAGKDARFVPIHKPNGGVSQARNAALQVLKGEFFLCVDPDDYIAPDHIENLVRAQARRDADLTIGRFIRVAAGDGLVRRTLPPRGDAYYAREDFAAALPSLYREYRASYSTFRLYRASAFQDLRFPEDMKVSEDNIWMSAVIDRTRSIQLTDDQGYFYIAYEQGCLTKQIHPNLYQYHKRVHESIRATLDRNGWLTPDAQAMLDEKAVWWAKGPVASICRGPWPSREKIGYIEKILGDPLLIQSIGRLKPEQLDERSRLMASGDARALLRFYTRMYKRRALTRRMPDWMRRALRMIRRLAFAPARPWVDRKGCGSAPPV
jgi:glycosyltransferase involved in cell wall biosynthesis